MRLELDRLVLKLHGVSAQLAEAAVAGLAQELRRRLGNSTVRALVSRDLGAVHIGPLESAAVLDPAALRGLIAERLVLALSARPGEAD